MDTEDQNDVQELTEDGSSVSTLGFEGAVSSNGSERQAQSDNICEHQACSCHQKNTPRSDELQKNLERRLNRAIGQLNGVKSMIDENRYCGDILVQLAACESAIKSTSDLILHNHLETCVVEQIQQGNTDIIDEVMHLVRRFNK